MGRLINLKNVIIHPHERVDDLGIAGSIIQDPKGFCFGVDAVFLSDFAKVKKGETVLDIGTGTGIIPILLSAKTDGRHFTGLELQEKYADMARRSVEMNGLEEYIRIDCGDIKNAAEIYPPNCFDVVTVNPPYMAHSGGLLNESDEKAIARHEIACSLADIVAVAARLLKTGGRLYVIHRPWRLADLICTLRRVSLEPKVMQFVQDREGYEPKLVMIEAVDHGRSMLKVMPVQLVRSSDQLDRGS